jgi:hypothetical protein
MNKPIGHLSSVSWVQAYTKYWFDTPIEPLDQSEHQRRPGLLRSLTSGDKMTFS